MSATVDRLDELESGTAPLPWPVEFFYNMPGDAFQMLFALCQAWPTLRGEVLTAEATARALTAENTQLREEHERIRAGANELAAQLATEQTYARRAIEEMKNKVAQLTTAGDQLRATVRDLPARVAAAEAVCRSIDPHHRGSGGAYAHYDGAAHDQWKQLVLNG